MYKKVYIEITNNCNLSCDFCPHNKRKNEFITLDNFNIILDKLENYTKYLYLHVLGEPLLHPNINEIIDTTVLNILSDILFPTIIIHLLLLYFTIIFFKRQVKIPFISYFSVNQGQYLKPS